MSLPHLNWRYVGAATPSASTVPAVLDAIYSLGQATTYANSTTRTVGSGSAGTWSRYQDSGTTECLYVTTPVAALNHRIMLAGVPSGTTPSPTPTLGADNSSFYADKLYANVVKNAGAFTTWNAANPFGSSSQTMGYWPFDHATTSVTKVRLWESKEAVVVVTENSSGAAQGCVFAGGIIDPESTDTIVDAESDGRLYGMCVSSTGGLSASMHSETQPTGFAGSVWPSRFLSYGDNGLNAGGANSGSRNGVFTPSSSSVITMYSPFLWTNGVSATTLTTRSGRYARLAMPFRGASNDVFLGRLRDICFFTDAIMPAVMTDGSTTIGYVLSGSSVSACDSLLLEHG